MLLITFVLLLKYEKFNQQFVFDTHKIRAITSLLVYVHIYMLSVCRLGGVRYSEI